MDNGPKYKINELSLNINTRLVQKNETGLTVHISVNSETMDVFL